MKLKEVCSKTGLTKRTIRFYEEKELQEKYPYMFKEGTALSAKDL